MTKKLTSDSPKHAAALRDEVRAAIIDAARITGWPALNRPALVAAFRGRVGRSTIYRRIDDLMGTPLDRSTAEMVRDARLGARAVVQSVAGEVQAKAAVVFPKVPSLEECAAATTPLPVMEKLNKCLAAAEDGKRCSAAILPIRNGM